MGCLRRTGPVLTGYAVVMLIVPALLVTMVLVLLVHGFVLRRRTSDYSHGVFFDVGGSHHQVFTNSMQDFAPSPRGRGFDTKYWTDLHWG